MKLTSEQKERIKFEADQRSYMDESMHGKSENMSHYLRIEIALERGTFVEPKRKMSSRELLSELNDHKSFNMKNYYANKQ